MGLLHIPASLSAYVENVPMTRIQREKVIHFADRLARTGGWVSLPAKLGELLYGSAGFAHIRGELERAGFLVVDPSYRAADGKGYCKRYRLTATGPKCAVETEWRPRVAKRRERRDDRVAKLSHPQRWVWLSLQRVKVPDTWREIAANDCEWAAMERIAKRNHFVSSDSYGRLHHTLVSAPKSIRSHLTLDGERLVGIDYSAWHVSLILALYPRQHPEGEKLADWLSGDFYLRLAPGLDAAARKAAKYSLLSAINDRNERSITYPIWRAFRQEFPYGAGIVRRLKEGNHANAAHVLQRMESSLIFDEVVRECAEQHIPVVSLHDALFCRESHAVTVREIMIVGARQVLGIDVQAKAA